MANPVPAGSDVSAGTDRCTSCSNEIEVGSTGTFAPVRNAATANTKPSAAATASTTHIQTARATSQAVRPNY
jgi:hypothetical protein